VIWYILRQTLLLYLLPFGTVAQLSTGEPGTAEFDWWCQPVDSGGLLYCPRAAAAESARVAYARAGGGGLVVLRPMCLNRWPRAPTHQRRPFGASHSRSVRGRGHAGMLSCGLHHGRQPQRRKVGQARDSYIRIQA